jgi:hypothetical protein
MDASATERDWFDLQERSRAGAGKGMFLRLTIACCLASIWQRKTIRDKRDRRGGK